MPVFGVPLQKKPKNVADKLGLSDTGGVVAPPASPTQALTEGSPMGGLAERALGKRQEQMGNGFDQPDRANFFNRKKKKEMNNGFTNAENSY